MIQIVGPHLTQWDDGREIQVTDTKATHAHFANQGDSSAVVMALVDGKAKIPNYLLQTGKSLCVYLVLNKVTQESKTFYVSKRERPEEYVYDDDRRNYIYELIQSAKESTESANYAAEEATNAAQIAGDAATSAVLASDNANVAAESANMAAKNANESAAKAAHTAKNLMVVGTARGENIVLDDAIDQYLVGCRIFGKTTQDGVPSPDAPVDLVSVENPTVSVNEQSMLVPYTLRGIPVSSGGNYTDAKGQQWVCDEVDLNRCVYIRRIGKKILDGTETWGDGGSYFALAYTITGGKSMGESCCSHFTIGLQSVSGQYFAGTVGFGFYHNSGSLAKWKAFLAEQKANGTPVVLVYILATPTETPLSEEELTAFATMKTSRGITTVSNDAGAYMEIQYVMDAKKYIDSVIGTGGGASAGIINATVE